MEEIALEPLKRLFGKWTEDLAPALSNPSQVVKERIIYRSAEEKSLLPLKGFKEDSMDVDLNDFTMPLGEPQTNKKSPETETPAKKKENEPVKRKRKVVEDIEKIGQTAGIDQVGKIGKIEQIGRIERIKQIKSVESI